jgi:hypothetical protein
MEDEDRLETRLDRQMLLKLGGGSTSGASSSPGARGVADAMRSFATSRDRPFARYSIG